MTNAELEHSLLRILKAQNANGVLMVIITNQNRAEVIALLRDEIDDLPGKLRRMLKSSG